jgi:hypothetical protein
VLAALDLELRKIVFVDLDVGDRVKTRIGRKTRSILV